MSEVTASVPISRNYVVRNKLSVDDETRNKAQYSPLNSQLGIAIIGGLLTIVGSVSIAYMNLSHTAEINQSKQEQEIKILNLKQSHKYINMWLEGKIDKSDLLYLSNTGAIKDESGETSRLISGDNNKLFGNDKSTISRYIKNIQL